MKRKLLSVLVAVVAIGLTARQAAAYIAFAECAVSSSGGFWAYGATITVRNFSIGAPPPTIVFGPTAFGDGVYGGVFAPAPSLGDLLVATIDFTAGPSGDPANQLHAIIDDGSAVSIWDLDGMATCIATGTGPLAVTVNSLTGQAPDLWLPVALLGMSLLVVGTKWAAERRRGSPGGARSLVALALAGASLAVAGIAYAQPDTGKWWDAHTVAAFEAMWADLPGNVKAIFNRDATVAGGTWSMSSGQELTLIGDDDQWSVACPSPSGSPEPDGSPIDIPGLGKVQKTIAAYSGCTVELNDGPWGTGGYAASEVDVDVYVLDVNGDKDTTVIVDQASLGTSPERKVSMSVRIEGDVFGSPDAAGGDLAMVFASID